MNRMSFKPGAMLKNAGRFFERMTSDDKLVNDCQKAFEAENQDAINEIVRVLRAGHRSPEKLEIRELSGGYFGETRSLSHTQGGEVAGFTWNKRYITFYADFFVLMELDDLENWEKENGPNKDMLADYIFLPDVNFSWKRMSEMEIMVTNRSRECTIRVKQKEHCSVILQHLCALKYLAMNNLNGCSSPIKQPISESSFPVRPHTPAKWYICGDAYMSNLADSIEAASERVFLADWQISPMIYLKRNYEGGAFSTSGDTGTYWRLDQVLKRAANRGVRIYILVYQDPTALGLKNYEATKYLRKFNRPESCNPGDIHGGKDLCEGEKCLWKKHANLFTLTHPTLDGPNKWSHHEKLAVIDDKIAFIGGLDLSMGRWDVHGKYFMFDPERRTFKGFDYWSQFNSKPNQNLIDCNYEKGENFFRTNCRFDENKDYLDRMTEMRTPWHDIAARLQGEAAFDVSLHFIERWNMTSHTAYQSAVKINLPVFRKIRVFNPFEKMQKQYIVPRIRSKVIRSQPVVTDGIPLAGGQVARQIDEVNTSCQIIRSAAAWSAGLRSTERTIYDNYKALIESAERFIFIENQFFVTTTGDYKLDDSLPQNQIALFLCDRIIKAFKKGEQFRVYIVIPCIPGSGGSLEENTAAGQEILLHITYESICRHENSIYEYLRRCEPTIEVEDFIYFASYRTHEEFNGGIHQAVVYPHSKLMIVDDRFTIIGSANINDRSLLGDRDSEIGAIIDSSPFAKSLRIRIWAVALGDPEHSLETSFPPESKEFFDYWKSRAQFNFQLFEDVFCVLPNNTVFALPGRFEAESEDWKKWKKQYDNRMAITDVEKAKYKMSQRRGFLVSHPLDFLKNEDRVNEISDFFKNPSAAFTKEGITQFLDGTMFQ